MKTLHFNQKILQSLAVITALPLICCWGCKPITMADISGTYSRNGNGVSDTLVLSSNGTFQQTITFTNGGRWSMGGLWVFKAQVVELDDCYAAFDFEHKTIVIPPKMVSIQRLWVEKGQLVKNEYEPKWIKK